MTPNIMDQTKILTSIILFLATFICGYLPVKFILNQDHVQYAFYTGGGVLMATSFCHLIPETHDKFKHVMQSTEVHQADNHQADNHHAHSHSIHYVEILMCCGFFFMCIVEQLMTQIIATQSHDLTTVVDVESTDKPTTTPANGLYKFIRGLLIISAFIIHSIFDGVAIGSQSTTERVWEVFIAISCHKLVIAAVLGLELFGATLKSHFWTLVHLSIFSLMSPLGIILVVVAQNSFQLKEDDTAMLLTQAFANGTLLYVIFVEILQPKNDGRNLLAKNLCLVGGFAIMVTVSTLMEGD